MRFIDLFCGPGLGSLGLVRSGMKPAMGADNAPAILEAYSANIGAGRRSTWEHDFSQPLSSLLIEAAVRAQPDVVWLSPPDSGQRRSAGGWWQADQDAERMTANAVGLAARCAPAYIVMERLPGALTPAAMRVLCAQLHDYQSPDVHALDAHQHAGSPARRMRVYAIWSRRGRRRPEVRPVERTVSMVEGIDMCLPVSSDLSRLGARCYEAVARLAQQGGGVVESSRSGAVPYRMSDPLPPITRNGRLLCVYDGGWREMGITDYRRALGAPPSFQLAGQRPAQHVQITLSTDARVSELIGRALIEAGA